jgi:hypothetical protein
MNKSIPFFAAFMTTRTDCSWTDLQFNFCTSDCQSLLIESKNQSTKLANSVLDLQSRDLHSIMKTLKLELEILASLM